MTQHAVLNNTHHRNLRINMTRGAEYGDDIMSALTFPAEFRNIQTYYPIVFEEDGQGSYQPVALFGLLTGQNLFLEGNRWDAHYIPLAVEREPFLIGRSQRGPEIHIDLDHPRVGTESGHLLFEEHGGTTDFFEHVSSVLGMLHAGVQETASYIAALQEHDLLESFVLDVELSEDEHNRLMGYHTINEDRLHALDGDALGKLSAAGHLLPTFMVLASLTHLRDLIERYRQRQPYG